MASWRATPPAGSESFDLTIRPRLARLLLRGVVRVEAGGGRRTVRGTFDAEGARIAVQREAWVVCCAAVHAGVAQRAARRSLCAQNTRRTAGRLTLDS